MCRMIPSPLNPVLGGERWGMGIQSGSRPWCDAGNEEETVSSEKDTYGMDGRSRGFFVPCPRGLERLLEQELHDLGVPQSHMV